MNSAKVEEIPPAAQVGKEDYLPCLSLWQPWASAIALGLKQIETRSWGRHYHGPIAIHASSQIKPEAKQADPDLRTHPDIAAKLPALKDLSCGGIVCIARVIRIFPIPQKEPEPTDYRDASGQAQRILVPPPPDSAERKLGAYLNSEDEMRWGWILADVMPFSGMNFLPYKGMQGLFKIEGTTARGLLSQYRLWCLDQRPRCVYCDARFGDPDFFRRPKPANKYWEHCCPSHGGQWQNAAVFFKDYSRCMPFLDGWIPELSEPAPPTLELTESDAPLEPLHRPEPEKARKPKETGVLSFDF